MVLALTVISNDIPEAGQIPSHFKNNSICGEVNCSPHIDWSTFSGFVLGHVEYWNLYVEDLGVSGSSPNGRFLHWGVTNIDPVQTAIAMNGNWMASPTILSTDFASGDRISGWNGPCPSNGTHNYKIIVQAKIKESDAAYVWGEETPPEDFIIQAEYLFNDYVGNQGPSGPSTGECGTLNCPPGSTLIGDQCQTIESTPVQLNPIIYEVADAINSTAWGWAGTRFYPDDPQYILPYRGAVGDALLWDDDGNGAPLSVNLESGNDNVWDPPVNDDTRLNRTGVWTTIGTQPVQEWIGFSRCIVVPDRKMYCIGLAADNQMRFKINGQIIARFDRGNHITHFNYWHVIEIELQEGANIIEIEAYNQGGPAGFGAEIYDIDIATLEAYTTNEQVEAVRIWSTVNKIGESFDIGEDSGYTCPDGTAFDTCEGGDCKSIVYVDAETVECCWRIENCRDENDTYLIKLSVSETNTIYIGSTYSFDSHIALQGKCFTVVEQVVCEQADMENVTVDTAYGNNACNTCDSPYQFESCDDPGDIKYLKFADPDVIPVIDNIYELDAFSGCYIYRGPAPGFESQFNNVTINIDHDTDYCLICESCHHFRRCDTDSDVYVRFAENAILPTEGYVYTLNNGPGTNVCLVYQGTAVCDRGDENYTGVTINTDKECKICDVCVPYYKAVNCADPEDFRFFRWAANSLPLQEGLIYVFSFDNAKCYTVELQFSPCEDWSGPIYEHPDIEAEYSTCEQCTQTCYKLVDCNAGHPDVATINPDFATYVGQVIRWRDESEAPNYIDRCATVEAYTCRLETYPSVNATVVDCFDNCDECYEIKPNEREQWLLENINMTERVHVLLETIDFSQQSNINALTQQQITDLRNAICTGT